MPTTVEIPGVGTVEFPDSMSREEIQGAARGLMAKQQQPEPEIGFGEAFGRAGLERFVSNAVGLPNLLATGAANLGAAFLPTEQGPPRDIINMLAQSIRGATGGAVDPIAAGERTRAATPALGERVLPLPEAQDVVAGGEAAVTGAAQRLTGQSPPLFGERFAGAQERQELAREQRPGATLAGEVGADVGTLLTGRLPFAAARARPPMPAPRPALPPGLKRQIDDIVRTKIVGGLGRGVVRAAETGTEAAVLALLDEGDPVNPLLLGAGGQAGGSLLLTLAKTKTGTIAAGVATAAVMIQMFKESTPGGRDRILESIETATEKAAGALALGAVAGLAGAGRVGGRVSENLPKIADAITAIPRGGMISLAKDILKPDTDDAAVQVLELYSKNPEAFGSDRAALERAITSGKEGEFTKTVDRLMRRSGFRRRLDRLATGEVE